MKAFKKFLENLVMIAITLVIVFTFVEDLATYLMWDWNIRKVLLFTGFGFDLFFTLEFIFRYTASIAKGDTVEYLVHKRGWVDFVASVPLLLFNSGPTVFFLLSGAAFAGGAGVLNILKVVKAVRVARILRMLRVLKIFRSIKSVDSVMTQRHMTRIISTVVVSVIAVMFFGSLLFSEALIASPAMKVKNSVRGKVVEQIDSSLKEGESLSRILNTRTDILLVKNNGKSVFSRFTDSQYERDFGPGDYQYEYRNKTEVFFDLRYQNAEEALPGMLLLLTIVFTVVVLMLFYSPHFAMTISDPVFVMLKGMKEKNYNLEVDIPGRYKKDDIFRLSAEYNDKFLTLKARENEENSEGESVLKLEDLGDLSSLLG
ncbi:MAG: ion transporter [Spirochaetales bacterium]|nr:ion transporter [Spirochaetales bacterium]